MDLAGLKKARTALAATAERIVTAGDDRERLKAERDQARDRMRALQARLTVALKDLDTPEPLRRTVTIADFLQRSMPAKPSKAAMWRAYEAAGLHEMPDTFVLYRIIGNDLYPRHQKGQSRCNVAFILENEPLLEGCEKRWVLNRIVDPQEREAIISLLSRHRQSWIEIPFEWEEYAKAPWDYEPLKDFGLPASEAFDALKPQQQNRAEVQIRRHKNNYLMNNNGARNAALSDGLGRAKWVLPWDGNCFLTAQAWRSIRDAVTGRPWLKHFVVPMARITDNEALLEAGFQAEASEEPQILFRCDSKECFDDRHPYGRRPKVDLFWRLGIPGVWDSWVFDPWDIPPSGPSPEAHQFGEAGWVARLASGQNHLEVSTPSAARDRTFARSDAIVATIDRLDVEWLYRKYDPDNLVAYDPAQLKRLKAAGYGLMGQWREAIIAEARAALGRGPYSVTAKADTAPSGDIHDFWHAVSEAGPDPDLPEAFDYTRADVRKGPGRGLRRADARLCDRTQLQRMIDDSSALALGWSLTGESEMARHGARLVRTWFVNRSTRMNPHLTFSRFDPQADQPAGAPSGIAAMNDLYVLLDAVRLLDQAGAFSGKDRAALEAWLDEYLNWLTTSEQGLRQRRARNHHGIWYDLQRAAILAYLGDVEGLLDVFCFSRQRLYEHFNPDGFQPHQMRRTNSAHFACLNLQGWVNLARLADACGDDLWNFAMPGGQSIRKGLEWMLPYLSGEEWPFEQAEPFDTERFVPLYQAYVGRFGVHEGMSRPAAASVVRPVFHPHAGIKPYWAV